MGLTKLSQKELKQKLAGRSKDLKDILKDEDNSKKIRSGHPVELMAVSYGFLNKEEMSE